MAPLGIRIPVRFEGIPFKWDFGCQPCGPPASALTLPRLNHPSALPGVTTPMHQSNHGTSQLKRPPAVPGLCPGGHSQLALSLFSSFCPGHSGASLCMASKVRCTCSQGSPDLSPCVVKQKSKCFGAGTQLAQLS